MEDLQDTVVKIPASDVLIVLGDFNARVGSSVAEDDLWTGVCGKHGVGACNEAGMKFLEFYAVNQFTIMNTCMVYQEGYPSGDVETSGNEAITLCGDAY